MEPTGQNGDALFFFREHMGAFGLYGKLERELLSRFPGTVIRVQKTQISFSNRHIYACVSFMRVRRKAELPDPYLVLTLGMPYPLESSRVAVKTEPYPRRWTTHILLSRPDELDEELFSWVREAYDFSMYK